MTESSSSALCVKGLTVRYGGVLAVDDLSLTVDRGEIVGLVGPNGAGKTSSIDAISGFVRSYSGSVVLDQECLDGRRPHHRARAGLIRTFQQLELFDDLTVLENIDVAARSSGRSTEEGIASVVEMLELDEDLERTVRDLPQGRRRLVAMARAVACRPTVLMLDEPAAGLDTEESTDLGLELRALAAVGCRYLVG